MCVKEADPDEPDGKTVENNEDTDENEMADETEE